MTFDFTREPGKKLNRAFVKEKQVPLVTVITPFYNAGKYFEQTFRAVINQTFSWFEWIIVDDGSTEQASIELLERLSKLDERITVYRKENGGISTARNLAIKKSNTDLIIPLDADDLISQPFLNVSILDCILMKIMIGLIRIVLGLTDRSIPGIMILMQKN